MSNKRIVLSIVAITLVWISGCTQQQFSPNEAAFLKRCPEVKLGKIAPEDREIFMEAYEQLRPQLDGKDVRLFALSEDVASLLKEDGVEIDGEDVQLEDGSTFTPMRIKRGGASLHKQVVQSYSQSFVSSFLEARN